VATAAEDRLSAASDFAMHQYMSCGPEQFNLVALAQALRIYMEWPVMIADWSVPKSVNWVTLVVAGSSRVSDFSHRTLNSEDAAAWALTQQIFAVQGRGRADTRFDAAVFLHSYPEVSLHVRALRPGRANRSAGPCRQEHCEHQNRDAMGF